MVSLLRDRRGSSLIEVLLATALTGLFVAASAGGLAYGVRMSKEMGRKNQAVYLCEEGLAAAQNMRDESFTELMDGVWGLSVTGGQWELVGTPDTTDLYERTVMISSVDATTKEVTATVGWPDLRGAAREVSLATYLTDWRGSTAVPAWATVRLAGYLDLADNVDILGIDIAGDYAYGIRDANGTANFAVYDISLPGSPTQVGSLDLPGRPMDIVVLGDYAYVASTNNSQEVQIVSIATPSAPTLATSYNAGGNANALGVAVVDTTLYVARAQGGDKELLVFDVMTPSSPALFGSLDLTGDANAVAVSSSYAYVASGANSQELQVVDVTTPATPSLVGSYNLPTNDDATDVAVSGTTVYLGNGTVLQVLSAATPTAPTALGSLSIGATVHALEPAFGGSYVFVASAALLSEIALVNATNTALPTLAAILDLGGQLFDVAYDETLDMAVGAGSDNVAEFVIFAE